MRDLHANNIYLKWVSSMYLDALSRVSPLGLCSIPSLIISCVKGLDEGEPGGVGKAVCETATYLLRSLSARHCLSFVSSRYRLPQVFFIGQSQ